MRHRGHMASGERAARARLAKLVHDRELLRGSLITMVRTARDERSPFFNFRLQHGKHVLAVLKANNPALPDDARGVFRDMPPGVRQEPHGRLLFWDVEGFTTSERMEAPWLDPQTARPHRNCPNRALSAVASTTLRAGLRGPYRRRPPPFPFDPKSPSRKCPSCPKNRCRAPDRLPSVPLRQHPHHVPTPCCGIAAGRRG